MKRRTYSIIGFLFVFAFVFSFSFNQKAKAGSAEDERQTIELPYDGCEGIYSKIISYVPVDKEISIIINKNTYTFKTEEMVGLIGGDEYGTIWFDTLGKDGKIFWLNYELEGSKMVPHYFVKGYLGYKSPPYFGSYVNSSDTSNYLPLPSPKDLSNLLNNPNPTFNPTTIIPTETPNVTVSPTKKPIPTKKPAPTPKVVKEKISKSKKTKTKVYLLSNTGKVLKEVKFSKKTGVMVYNKKKIKKVKDVFFTKKGTVVYFTKSKKAYYFIGKKRILIKSKVSSIKTYKGLATQLVIKKGKKAKKIKLKK